MSEIVSDSESVAAGSTSTDNIVKRRAGEDANGAPVPVDATPELAQKAAQGDDIDAIHAEIARLKRETAEIYAEMAAAALPELDNKSLSAVVATLRDNHAALFKQPSPPSSLPLWWQLGEKNYSNIDELADGLQHALIGLSGSGKTRTMFELLSKHYGFYWTCRIALNGGAAVVQRAIEALEFVSDVEVVNSAVDRLLTIYAGLISRQARNNTA
jgi:hypothetical protein